MKQLIPILAIMLLASCRQSIDIAADTSNGSAIAMVPAAPCMVTGHFLSPTQTDTLIFRRYSNSLHRYIDSLPEWGDDYEWGDDIDWFREHDMVMKVTTADGSVVHTDSSATYVLRAIPLPGILHGGMDALAVVLHHQDFSAIKPCWIVSVADGQWTELGSLTLNVNHFPDTLTDGIIDDFLELRDGQWVYREWAEILNWEGDGECPMHPLSEILADSLYLQTGRRNTKTE